MPRHVSFGRTLRQAAFGVLGAGAMGSVGAGCLDRPVVPSSPVTTARFVATDTSKGVDKIDLVFMIDNSSSMADKQQILQAAVPDVVNRLVNPQCVDADTQQPVGTQPSDPSAACPQGVREFESIKDIHIGLITSSLGGHGADTCSPGLPQQWNQEQADMGHLINRKLGGGTVATYQDSGFLFWDTSSPPHGNPQGETSITALIQNFQDMTVGVDQQGCGFEASLEAVYRFLADPNPYGSLSLNGAALVKNDTDTTLLAQRAAFLRPDSLLAIVSISDENDCSVREDEGQNYYIVIQSTSGKKQFRMFRPTSECANNPNDPCCTSCALPTPAGCTDHGSDPNCQQNGGKLLDSEDALNLRCWNQKQRFGVDFLYPPQRYVDMLLNPTIGDQPNPIYSNLSGTDGATIRSPQDVFWAMIVGVPWQDIARDPTDLTKGYLPTTASEDDTTGADFVDRHTWDLILGDPDNYKAPGDPLMVESIAPRSGTHLDDPQDPNSGEALVPPSGTPTQPPALDPKLPNGHEWDISATNDDLQYACVFPLPTPRDCSGQATSCDCSTAVTNNTQNPLCQDSNGAETTMQYRAKGYPGLRHLQVAKGLGAQGIVASICPSNLTGSSAADYGYRPAIGAIIDRLKTRLKGKCLNRALQPNTCPGQPTTGQVPCIVLEVTNTNGGSCDCSAAGRSAAPAEAITDDVRKAGDCICQIDQLEGSDLTTCQQDTSDSPGGGSITGFCYVDPTVGVGNAALTKKCAANQQRILRFVGNNTPVKDATVFYACQEAAFDPSAGSAGGSVSSTCTQ